MEVFISWSGPRSEKVAEALRDWLPNVIQSVTPFMSAADIGAGSRWSSDLADHLGQAEFGLICLTPDNLEAPWLLFEAGALSKSLENSRVVPYLHGVSKTTVQGPLAQFQAEVSDRSSTLDVIKAINEASGENGLEASRLNDAFDTWWPKLKEKLDSIPETTEEAPPMRSDRDILEEILVLCRQVPRQSASSLDYGQGSDTERSLSGSELRQRALERLMILQEKERLRSLVEERLRAHRHSSPEGDAQSSDD